LAWKATQELLEKEEAEAELAWKATQEQLEKDEAIVKQLFEEEEKEEEIARTERKARDAENM